MLRTRVGYSGGTTPSPTYHNLGDHSESIQIDFDPSRISYEELLTIARASGNFGGRSWSRQYRSAVFYHNDAQREAAVRLGLTEVEPFRSFTRAEDYHQKYYLQQSALAREFYAMFPSEKAWTDATATARANAIVGGHMSREQIEAVLPVLGVSEATGQKLLKLAGTSVRGCALPAH